MKTSIASIVAAAAFLFAGFAQAQQAAAPAAAPAAEAPAKAHHDGKRFDCAKAKDQEKCEARHKEMRERFADAKKACAGKDGDERRACYSEAMCAKAQDPQKCKEQGEKRALRHAEMKKACGDKQGDEMRACMREQFKDRKKGAGK